MVGSTVGLVVLGLALPVFAGPMFTVSDHAARDMLDRTSYIHAVLVGNIDVPMVATPGGGK
jgi:multicomponent Na+:H+ antiporter subunit D